MKFHSSLLKKLNYRLQAWLLDRLARACHSASLKTRKKLADLLSFIAFRIIKLRRRQVVESMQKHLELNLQQAEELARKTYASFLLNAFSMAGLKFMSDEELKKMLRVEGFEHLQNALSRKKGVIIVSGHFGLWELVPPWLALNGNEVTVVVRRQNNPYVDQWFEEMRNRHGARTTDSGFGIREILKSLRRGHILALMADQDNGKQGIFIRFFNEWASAPTGPAQISLKTGAPIVPLAGFPDFQNGHLLKIFAPLYPENYSEDLAGQQRLTSDYSRIIEKFIRQQPNNWFWLHRRWKTRPQDAPENPWTQLITGKQSNLHSA